MCECESKRRRTGRDEEPSGEVAGEEMDAFRLRSSQNGLGVRENGTLPGPLAVLVSIEFVQSPIAALDLKLRLTDTEDTCRSTHAPNSLMK